jgi:hypothetical protein
MQKKTHACMRKRAPPKKQNAPVLVLGLPRQRHYGLPHELAAGRVAARHLDAARKVKVAEQRACFVC